jgi:aminoglycoside 3-N-acetyltransferase
MVSYRDLVTGLRQLRLNPQRPVIAHASLSAFGDVRGGPDTLLGAILMNVDTHGDANAYLQHHADS